MARDLTSSEWGRVYAHAWLDPEFHDQLSTDPASAVKSYLGLADSDAVRVHAVPAAPADLSKDQLESIRSGDSPNLLAAYCC